jgi:hypothetical protein
MRDDLPDEWRRGADGVSDGVRWDGVADDGEINDDYQMCVLVTVDSSTLSEFMKVVLVISLTRFF